MTRMMRPVARGIVILSALAASACAFQRTEEVGLPTAPSAPTSPSTPTTPTSGSLTGVWASLAANAIGGPTSCGSFEWHITGQTPTSLAGDFWGKCLGVLAVSGYASGQLNGNDVPFQIDGNASYQGAILCPFTLTGTGHIIDGGDAIRIPYSGTTCLGPLQGEEILRRPPPSAPPPPEPEPPAPEPPPAPPAPNPNHVPDGPLTEARAQQVVDADGREFPNLIAPRNSQGEKAAATEELLLRTIWHLQLAGYQSGRQRNPSGAISSDKLTIVIDNRWHAYDIYTDWDVPGRSTRIIFLEVGSPNPIGEGGIPD